MYNKHVSLWRHKRPKKYYDECIKMFGEPTFVSNVPHGYALWRRPSQDIFVEHLLIDENVKHDIPKPHYDYFYSRIRCVVPKHKVCDVLKISGSIMYDGLKKELTARCGGIGANCSTLLLGLLVAMDCVSIDDVERHSLYPAMIRGEIIKHEEMNKEIRDLLNENYKKYKHEYKQPFSSFTLHYGGRSLNEHWRD